MSHPILVVTSTQGFGELIEQTLNDTGLYQATLVGNSGEALKKARSRPFELVILDEECDSGTMDFISGLRGLFPGIGLVVIPVGAEPCPEIAALGVQGTLSKPFYLPDLLEIVSKTVKNTTGQKAVVPGPEQPVVSGSVAASKPPPPVPVDWLQDADRAAQQLTSLTLESSALAALIVRDRKLWSYAGQLPQPAAQELTLIIANYWSQGVVPPPGRKVEGKSDMARFIRLETTGQEYMIYATEVGGAMVLALVFDAETPFGKIRTQVSRLARAMTMPPASMPPLTKGVAPPPPPVVKPVPVGPALDDSEEPLEEEDIPHNLPPLWDDVPPPNPSRPGLGKVSSQDLSSSKTVLKVPPPSLDTLTRDPKLDVHSERKLELSPIPSESQSPAQPEEQLAQAQTLLYSGLQPVSPAVYELTYACLIIPRMTRHHLTGDLAERLAIWLGELCMAFEWKLENVLIQPDFLQWIVNVPPTNSPGYIIRVIRQQTSQRIFSTFPELARENPSGDFWAAGYLVMSSAHVPPDQVIKDFIQQIRQHQGASRPFSTNSRGS